MESESLKSELLLWIQRNMFAFWTKRSVALSMPKKFAQGLSVAASESVHKRMDFTAQRGSFKGFPCELKKKKIIGKGEAGQPSEFQPLISRSVYISPQRWEHDGEGQHSSPKKGLFGNHLILDEKMNQLSWKVLLKESLGLFLAEAGEEVIMKGQMPGLLNQEHHG